MTNFLPMAAGAVVPVSAQRPVVVVGAGPVGMTAAAALAQAGLPVIVLELHPEPQPDWRASTFHAATLELLDAIGMTGEMHAEGLVVPTYQFRDRRDGLIAEFDFRLLADETRYPYRLQLNQQRLVRMLFDRLKQRPECAAALRHPADRAGIRGRRAGAAASRGRTGQPSSPRAT